MTHNSSPLVSQDNWEKALEQKDFSGKSSTLASSGDLRIFTTASVFIGMAYTYADWCQHHSKLAMDVLHTSVKNMDPDFMRPWGGNLNVFNL